MIIELRLAVRHVTDEYPKLQYRELAGYVADENGWTSGQVYSEWTDVPIVVINEKDKTP